MAPESRTALVTGGSRGLGRALTRALVQRGWTVIVDARDGEALERSTGDLGEQAVRVPGDVAAGPHREELRRRAETAGGLDLVVNNASTLGVSPLPPLLDYPLDALMGVFRANVLAPLALLQAVRPHLKPGATIVNVSSDAGVEAYEGWGGYGASKAALEQISAVLAVENPSLRVYWVDPGDMRTQMHQEAFPGEDISDRPPPEEIVPGFLELIEGDHPSGRYSAQRLSAAVAG